MHTLQKKIDPNPKLSEPDPLIEFGKSLSPILFKSLVAALVGLTVAIGLIWTDHPVSATLALVVSIICVLFGGYIQQCTITITQSQSASNYQSERFLFGPIHRLIERPDITEPFSAILKSVKQHTGASHLAVYVFEEQTGQLAILAIDVDQANQTLPSHLPLRVLSQIEKNG